MIARKIGYAVAGLVILSSGAYLFVYLYRWEWNRALIAGVIFVAAEVALATMMLFEKLRSIEEKIAEVSHDQETLRHIEESAPASKVNFRWLAGDDGEQRCHQVRHRDGERGADDHGEHRVDGGLDGDQADDRATGGPQGP